MLLDTHPLASTAPSRAPERKLTDDIAVSTGSYVVAYASRRLHRRIHLYHGGKNLCGKGTPGWRWLDVRKLATDLIANRSSWPAVTVERDVYCTARISARENPVGEQEQDAYLTALTASGIVDHIEYGHYVNRTAIGPRATANRRGRPVITTPTWPVKIRNGNDQNEPNTRFVVSVARREEKGSDVNVAAHLLWDVLWGQPGQRPLEASGCTERPTHRGSGKPLVVPDDRPDFYASQLPNPAAGVRKPPPW